MKASQTAILAILHIADRQMSAYEISLATGLSEQCVRDSVEKSGVFIQSEPSKERKNRLLYVISEEGKHEITRFL